MAVVQGSVGPTPCHTAAAGTVEFMVALADDGWTIFILDDDDSVRKGLTRLMRASGFEVRAFAAGKGFVEECATAKRTCILLDITMPGISGLHVQAELQERGIDLPIIAISARDDESTRILARTLGARFFLRKPVDDRALLDAIAWVTGARV